MRCIVCGWLAVGLFLSLVATASAQTATVEKAPSPFAQVEEDVSLPRVLILGDSISIGYTIPVRSLLAGKANVQRAATNCGPTTRGLEQMDAWIGDTKWDVIHFNFGLHDLKFMDETGKLIDDVDHGHQQVLIDVYEKNLETIVTRLEKTGAVLVFATTTPVPEGAAGRIPADVGKYNEAALRVMKRHDIAVDDLYHFVLEEKDVEQLPANVHYADGGYKKLAEQVARSIEAAIPEK